MLWIQFWPKRRKYLDDDVEMTGNLRKVTQATRELLVFREWVVRHILWIPESGFQAT